ncbi:MAG: FAD-dependent oxidoreductase [Caldilineaceae bacterium]
MVNYDLAIIGGGPGGLAAAAIAHTNHIKFILITPDLGGKVNYGFALRDRPPQDSVWSADLVHEFEKTMEALPDHHLKEQVSQVIREENKDFRITISGAQGVEHTIRSKTVIICSGAKQQRLFIPGEKEYWGRGVSFSALSHTAFFDGKDVAIIGYGERMLVATLKLASIGRKVYVIPTMAFDDQDRRSDLIRQHPAVEILEGWGVQEVVGDEFVTGLMIGKGYEQRMLAVEGVFVQLGLLPNTDFLGNLVTVDPETGCIPIDQRCATEVPGLYAAGDVTNIFAEQVPVAVGEGIKAAISAWEYIVTNS